MTKNENGFSFEKKFQPGRILYKFKVDGKWTIDENEQTLHDNKGNIYNFTDIITEDRV
jgi:hypothetical protein